MEKRYHICKQDGCHRPTRDPKRNKQKGKGTYIHYKDCHVCANLMSNYGITGPQRDALCEQQDWRCKICDIKVSLPPEGDKKTRHKTNAVVDHCHDTGKIRGILCSQCNRGIGLLQDNPDIMRKAADYVS